MKSKYVTLPQMFDELVEKHDKLRAVLEGAEYPHINNLYNMSIEDCRRVGEATAGLTKSIIASYKAKVDDISNVRNAELGEIVWKFTNDGVFKIACLVPGHYDTGMHGDVTVAKK